MSECYLKSWRDRCLSCIESGSGFDPAEGPLESQAEGVRQVLGFTEALEGRPLFALQSAAFAAGQDHGWGNVGPQEAIHTGRMLALRWLRQELGEGCGHGHSIGGSSGYRPYVTLPDGSRDVYGPPSHLDRALTQEIERMNRLVEDASGLEAEILQCVVADLIRARASYTTRARLEAAKSKASDLLDASRSDQT